MLLFFFNFTKHDNSVDAVSNLFTNKHLAYRHLIRLIYSKQYLRKHFTSVAINIKDPSSPASIRPAVTHNNKIYAAKDGVPNLIGKIISEF